MNSLPTKSESKREDSLDIAIDRRAASCAGSISKAFIVAGDRSRYQAKKGIL